MDPINLSDECDPINTYSDYSDQLFSFLNAEERAERDSAKETVGNSDATELSRDQDRWFRQGITILSHYSRPLHFDLTTDDRTDLSQMFWQGVVVAILVGDDIVATAKVIDKIDEGGVRVQVYRDGESPSHYESLFAGTGSVDVAELYHPITYDRQREALHRIQSLPSTRLTKPSPKWSILIGQKRASFAARHYARSSQKDVELYSNQRQAEAIIRALTADHLACIQGPPGTGKTRVIVELVRRLVETGKTVLLVADSNPAADNALAGKSTRDSIDPTSLLNYDVHSDTSDGELSIFRENDRRSEHPAVIQWSEGNPLSVTNANVVVTTTNSAARLVDEIEKFDHAIVDEAGQATAPSTCVPYSIANTVILIGDQKQLPPYRNTRPTHSNSLRHLSLFEHFYEHDGVFGPQIGVQFDQQYRMHDEISDISSELFYGSSIETAIDYEPILDTSVRLYDVPPGSKSNHNEYDKGTSKRNYTEAYVCAHETKLLLDGGLSSGQIGIATPYGAQADTIENKLKETSVPDYRDITVDTIRGFQGSEREAMILSLTRSNSTDNVGFFATDDGDGPNRLNVGITRGKRNLTLVGDWDTLTPTNIFNELYDLATDRTNPIELDADLVNANLIP